MSARRIAFALAALAIAVQLVFTRAWQQEAAALSTQHHALLEQQRELRRTLAGLEARAALRAQAAALIGRSAALSADDQAVRKVRTAVVQVLDGVESSRLDVRCGPAPAVATVTLSTEGDFATIVDIVSALAQPSTSLLVRRLNIERRGGRVGLQLDASALGGSS